MSERIPLCFTCGQPIGMDPFANRLTNGEPCPTCRDRILEAAPAPLPGWGDGVEADGGESSPWGEGTEPASEANVWGRGPDDFDGPIGA